MLRPVLAHHGKHGVPFVQNLTTQWPTLCAGPTCRPRRRQRLCLTEWDRRVTTEDLRAWLLRRSASLAHTRWQTCTSVRTFTAPSHCPLTALDCCLFPSLRSLPCRSSADGLEGMGAPQQPFTGAHMPANMYNRAPCFTSHQLWQAVSSGFGKKGVPLLASAGFQVSPCGHLSVLQQRCFFIFIFVQGLVLWRLSCAVGEHAMTPRFVTTGNPISNPVSPRAPIPRFNASATPPPASPGAAASARVLASATPSNPASPRAMAAPVSLSRQHRSSSLEHTDQRLQMPALQSMVSQPCSHNHVCILFANTPFMS
jgi:hypothetical protein